MSLRVLPQVPDHNRDVESSHVRSEPYPSTVPRRATELTAHLWGAEARVVPFRTAESGTSFDPAMVGLRSVLHLVVHCVF